MSKDILTLVDDINSVITDRGGWDEAVNTFFKEEVGAVMMRRLGSPEEERTPTLRMSNIGKPCTRQLWYSLHMPTSGETLTASTQLKFLYGDLLEALLLSLAKAAGHDVQGCQDKLDCYGIKGSRDAVIDGMTIDVKSASSYSYKKFKDNNLRSDDPFGYLRQLTGYVHAGADDPLVKYKRSGGFLVVDKQHGHICLDLYDLSPELDDMGDYVERIKRESSLVEPPPRTFEDIPEGKSGNRKLGTECSYCSYKSECWPGLRTFVYSRGPVFLTAVEREPKVGEG